MTTGTRQIDVVDLLLEQHEQIKQMFAEFEEAPQAQREERFHDIVRLLAVHEAAEELVVHPAARAAADADTVVSRRLEEEREAKQTLSELYDLGTAHPDFAARFSMLAAAVVQHAEHEETEEFPILLREIPEDERHRMARAVQAADAGNLVAGPPLAIFDRVRDALRDWRED